MYQKTRSDRWVEQSLGMEEWDRQIQEDFSPGGRGMALLEEAKADVREGRVKSMDKFLAEARPKQPKSKA